jgi:DNA-binding winged helix-turn-helix (wHTH) protein/TolB-like protein
MRMTQSNNDDRGREQPPADVPKSRRAELVGIGEWRAEASRNLLIGPDRRLRIEPRMMELLLYLADRPGAVVSREVLLAQLWNGVVVGDDALTQVVVKLRKALGDDPRAPRYIETVPKRGYRLVASIGVPDAPPPAAASAIADGSGRRLRASLIGAGAGVAVLLVLYLSAQSDASRPLQSAVSAAVVADPRPAVPMLAVMPFEVIGDQPAQRYLAEGLAAELALDLSRMSGMNVLRFDPSFERSGAAAGSAEAPVLRVFGAVQRLEDQIAVEVRLVDEANGHELWSERYYRPFGDLFAIRDEIEARIAETLSVRLSAARQMQDAHRYSGSLLAYNAFLQAKSALLTRAEGDNETAKAFYHEAIRLDAAFARAYAGLALAHAADYRNQWVEDGQATLRRAQEMARTAVQIDPELAEAHWVLGYVSAQRREHDQALAHLDSALAARPGYADALALKGGIETYVGAPEASIPLLREALRLKPSASHLYFLLLGRAYFFLGDLKQAEVILREALARNPVNVETHLYLAATLAGLDDREGALWEAEEVHALHPGFTAGAWLATYPMTDLGQTAQLASVLGSLEL